MRSEIGLCVHALVFALWRYSYDEPTKLYWNLYLVGDPPAAHVEAYWRNRLALALA